MLQFFFSNAGTGNKDYQSFQKRIGILNNNVMWKKQILENYVTLLFCLWENGQINNLMLQKNFLCFNLVLFGTICNIYSAGLSA